MRLFSAPYFTHGNVRRARKVEDRLFVRSGKCSLPLSQGLSIPGPKVLEAQENRALTETISKVTAGPDLETVRVEPERC